MVSKADETKAAVDTKPEARPRYEAPRIQVMSERDILNTFQLTQSMVGWWSTVAC
jgi:hypothetical protein